MAIRCHVEEIRDWARLEQLRDAWRCLANQAVEPNCFYEPFFLIPALRLLAADSRPRVLAIWAINEATSERVLAGLAPVERARVFDRLPLRAWRLWRHKYCFLTAPLIHRHYVESATVALLEWLRRSGAISVLAMVRAGEVQDAVERKAGDMCVARAERWERSCCETGTSAEDYIERAVCRKHRREYRRQERLLGERGEVEYRSWQPGEAIEPWAHAFLELEASGWKGRHGTAFASVEADRRFFQEMIAGAAADARLMMLGLYWQGRPIAMKLNFVCGEGSFAFKICYDESFSQYSPGALLELENIRQIHARGIAWMDSCADPGHWMMERVWRERRRFDTYYLGPKVCGASIAAPLAALKRAAQSHRDANSPRKASTAR